MRLSEAEQKDERILKIRTSANKEILFKLV
jgi:hypothetical protein